jgi:hypothetical protein
LREPVKARVRADAGFGLTVLAARAAEENFFIDAPDLGGTSLLTNRTPARGAFKNLLDSRAAGTRLHRSVSRRENCDTTSHRQTAESDQKDETEKDSKKDNLDAGFTGAHGKEKPGRETERDQKHDD